MGSSGAALGVPSQAPEHQQVILRGVVVAREQLAVEQVDMQVHQLHAGELLQGCLGWAAVPGRRHGHRPTTKPLAGGVVGGPTVQPPVGWMWKMRGKPCALLTLVVGMKRAVAALPCFTELLLFL